MTSVRTPQVGASLLTNSGDRVTLIDVYTGGGHHGSGSVSICKRSFKYDVTLNVKDFVPYVQ